MGVDEVRVGSLGAFHDVVSADPENWHRWFYRGHSRPDWRLVPKAGRPPYCNAAVSDQRFFGSWKRHAVGFLPPSSRELTDWDLLAIAQHHGLATRLLDWTFNALAAAFFAVVDSAGVVDDGCDAVVYAHYSEKDPLDQASSRPFDGVGVSRVRPSAVAPRISRQGGIFTVHGPATQELDEGTLPKEDRLRRILISRDCRVEFAKQLSHYGMNRLSLFPDLDGLSSHMNWVVQYLMRPGA